MDEVASLDIRIRSLEADLADRRLDRLSRSGKKASRATDGLTRTFLRFAGPAAIIAGTLSSINKAVSSTRTFEVLNAQLVTATGSAEGAVVAFEAIQDFASNTPYDLAQVTTAFTKMVNLGLDPSEKALTSYGDTASAMGKDLNQMVEAVADAATGEFERLKEFGIRASKQGDDVSFTFRGMTETVRFNAEEIEKYLIGLGENNFAGAMATRMDTLDGAISNLGDEWEKLWMNVGKQGVGGVIEDSIRGAIDILEEFNAMLDSGQIAGYLGALENRFWLLTDTVVSSFNVNNQLLSKSFESWANEGASAVEFITDAFSEFPENLVAILRIAEIELNTFREKTFAIADSIRDGFNPFSWMKDPLQIGAVDSLSSALDTIENERINAISAVLDEREESIAAWKADIAMAGAAREAYDRAKKARGEGGEDRLSQFKFNSGEDEDGENVDEGRAKELAAIDKKVAALEFEAATVNKTASEVELLKLANEGATKAQIEAAEAALNTTHAYEAVQRMREQQNQDNDQADRLVEQLQTEEEAIRSSEQKRRKIILDSTRLTQEEKREALMRIEQETHEELEELNRGYWERWLDGAREALTDFNELSGNVIENFSRSFGDAFESVILDSKDTDDALKDMLRGLLRSTVNALGQMAAQWMAYQAVELLVGKTTQASAASTQIANANAMVAMAGLNAFASTAAIPVVGPVAAPAASAAAIAATTPLAAAVSSFSLAGMAHDGITNVPKEGTWLLDKGERVTGTDLNRDLTEFLKRENDSARNAATNNGSAQNNETGERIVYEISPTLVFQLSGNNTQAIQSEIMSAMPRIVELTSNAVRSAINSGGPMARAVGRR